MVATKRDTPVLSCHPGSLNSFALKLKCTPNRLDLPPLSFRLISRSICKTASETLESLKERMARKLALPPGEASELELKYLWCDVYYSLEDEGNQTSLSLLLVNSS